MVFLIERPLSEGKKVNLGNWYNSVFYRWLGFRAIDGDKEKELCLYEAVQEIKRIENLEAVSRLKKEILPFIPKPRHKYALLKIEEVFGEVKGK